MLGITVGVVCSVAGSVWVFTWAATVAQHVQAQTWPSRPVKVIMATAAGSAPDVIARIVTDRLAQVWGQQILILNRPGAGGLIAMQALASAEKDGHTLYWPLLVLSRWCCRKPPRRCRSTSPAF